ncbi:ribosomal RNA processing protein [Histoplasma capsulatum var. duboisii H88]|uniref:Ribosomal RNA processing protein n=2 Tax=Ajellomyces capsulatus TaxID=5037 RepID=A0A8H7Z1E2_AJECA|nr:ribosomal RNA processing protein [Histoplasma capsulatum]QSS49533.1 ribosomal RNA processing protein [Histoplasma capsulatum var. duboisii H88]QSS68011.1 ribosomal RNA processing protein [Histoplasma capsulatum G186AR]
MTMAMKILLYGCTRGLMGCGIICWIFGWMRLRRLLLSRLRLMGMGMRLGKMVVRVVRAMRREARQLPGRQKRRRGS